MNQYAINWHCYQRIAGVGATSIGADMVLEAPGIDAAIDAYLASEQWRRGRGLVYAPRADEVRWHIVEVVQWSSGPPSVSVIRGTRDEIDEHMHDLSNQNEGSPHA